MINTGSNFRAIWVRSSPLLLPPYTRRNGKEKDPGQILQRELVILLLLRTPSEHQLGADQQLQWESEQHCRTERSPNGAVMTWIRWGAAEVIQCQTT